MFCVLLFLATPHRIRFILILDFMEAGSFLYFKMSSSQPSSSDSTLQHLSHDDLPQVLPDVSISEYEYDTDDSMFTQISTTEFYTTDVSIVNTESEVESIIHSSPECQESKLGVSQQPRELTPIHLLYWL